MYLKVPWNYLMTRNVWTCSVDSKARSVLPLALRYFVCSKSCCLQHSELDIVAADLAMMNKGIGG